MEQGHGQCPASNTGIISRGQATWILSGREGDPQHKVGQKQKKDVSVAGNRTRVLWVKATCPNRLDYYGTAYQNQIFDMHMALPSIPADKLSCLRPVQVHISSAVTYGSSAWQTTVNEGWKSLGTQLEGLFAWDRLKVSRELCIYLLSDHCKITPDTPHNVQDLQAVHQLGSHCSVHLQLGSPGLLCPAQYAAHDRLLCQVCSEFHGLHSGSTVIQAGPVDWSLKAVQSLCHGMMTALASFSCLEHTQRDPPGTMHTACFV